MIAISAQTRIACSDGKTLHSQNGQKPKKELLLLPIFFKTTTTPELSSLLNNLRSRREKKFQKLLVHLPKLLPIELGFYGHGRKCLL